MLLIPEVIMRMKSSLVGVASLMLAVAVGASAASAQPAFRSENVIKVQADGDHRGFHRDHRGWTYYNGHRGYHHQRPGYRYYNGYWFPLAAFATGAVIGGAIAAAPPPPAPNPHVSWCMSNMPGYNAYDNTYQPAYGPRQYCHSPYGG
jgi:hypothetical protein